MTNDLPLITVIIPSYNHEKFVGCAIESVMNQTYKNIYLLIIDDGSTDNSVSVIERLREKYKFEFVVQENCGANAVLNKGIKNYAKGKYLAFLDSDDYWDIVKIEKQVQFMERNPQYGMCYAKRYLIDSNNNVRKPINNNLGKSGWLFDCVFQENFIPTLTVMLRREVFNEVGLYDEKLYYGDFDMWLRITKRYQIGFIDEYLAYYRLHNNNMHFNYNEMIKARLAIINKWKNENLYQQALINHYARWFNVLAGKEKILALKYLFLAFKVGANYTTMCHYFMFRGILKLGIPAKLTSLVCLLKRRTLAKLYRF